MAKVYLDPYVFAFPSGKDASELEEYIDNIIAWRDLRDSSWLQICISNKTLELLTSTSSYPSWEDLKTTIDKLGMNEIQPQDIMTLINGLLNKLPYIEDFLGITDILIDKMAVNPNHHLQNRIEIFKESHFYLVTLMAISSYREKSMRNTTFWLHGI